MRLQTVLLVAAATAAMWAGVAQAASVEVKDAVARVTVVPEDRTDIKVEIVRANSRLPIQVRTLGDRTIVDGDLDHGRRIRNCRSSGEKSSVEVREIGHVEWAEFPQIVIHTPRDVRIDADGAVFGSVGRSASLNLGNAGCGDWTVANVEGRARVSQAGSGDTRMGTTGTLKVSVAGSGDIAAADVKGGLDINIAGSGSAAVRSVNGPLEVSIAGSGDVVVGGGRATTMKVSVAGSGDVEFKGTADSLRASIAGSGDVHAEKVNGDISKMIMGSGSVRVGS
jgi:copper(I)-binding protein